MDRPHADVRALLITGTVGSGKTSVADALGDLLSQAGIPGAVLDVDWLRRSWPTPPGDPFNGRIALRNLRAVARTYIEAGVARIVVAGVVESHAERDDYQAALGIPLTVCRLRANLATVRERLAHRYADDGTHLPWHLARCAELEQILARARVEDILVDAERGSVRQVAEAVKSAVGW